MARVYKDYKVYACFALNRLAAELKIDIHQAGLEAKLDILFSQPVSGVSKEAIKHEIRSNHYMTEKVIQSLVDDGLAELSQNEGRYTVRITPKGVLHLRKFNEFYIEIYQDFIREHYRFSGPPRWLRDARWE